MKEIRNQSPLTDEKIVHIEKKKNKQDKEFARKLLKLINELNKATDYKINIHKSVVISNNNPKRKLRK